MVVREYDYIRGNTVLAPERKKSVQEVKRKNIDNNDRRYLAWMQ